MFGDHTHAQILEAMLTASPDQTTMLALALVAILDAPASRAYVRPKVDLEMVLAPLADVVNPTGAATSDGCMHARCAIMN